MVHLLVDTDGSYLDLGELQVCKNVSLQMMVYRTFAFRHIFYNKLYHIQVFNVRYEWPK